jgi:hypothetical protein
MLYDLAKLYEIAVSQGNREVAKMIGDAIKALIDAT